MQTTSVLNNERLNTANEQGAYPTWGFNCWGATLFVLEGDDSLRWVEDDEMTDWLYDNTDPIEEPTKDGDILVLWRYGSLWHTAVYMGEGQYFHKKGSNEAEITDISGVFGAYREHTEHTFQRISK